jgi:predicted glycosyltransferase involved in capsule biosynthesis
MDISVIIGVKDRNGERQGKCLESLEEQTSECRVVVVDYGSKRPIACDNATVVRVDRDTDVWCRSRALNIGAKKANTKYLMFTDIDFIFEPDFIEVVHKELTRKERVMVTCHPEEIDNAGRKVGHCRLGRKAVGGCQAVNRGWFFEVGGFDEFYKGKGLQDVDLLDRAKADRLKIVSVTGRTNFYHQWHEPQGQRMVFRNKEYFMKNRYKIIRNRNGWGEL